MGPVKITVSIGVTAVEAEHDAQDASKFEELLRAADRGLYASKQMGGNQVNSALIQGKKPIATRQTGGKNGIN